MIKAEYLAGLVDGEGCLTIHTSMRGRVTRSRTQARLSIANIHLPTLLALKAQWGGKIQAARKPKNVVRWKQGYELMWYNQAELIKVLDDIRPFLLIKREQVELFMPLYRPTMKDSAGAYHLTEAEYNQRHLAKVGLEQLKQIEFPLTIQ